MFRIATIALALTAATGCSIPIAALIVADALDEESDDYAYADDYPEDGFYADTGFYDNVGPSNARGQMDGEMPGTGPFDLELTEANIWVYPDTIEYDLHATGDNWAMIAGGIDTNALEEGSTVELSPGQFWSIGCSGPSPGNYIFDEDPVRLEVRKQTIEIEGQASLELTITATFRDGWQVTTVAVQPEQPNED